MQQYFADTPLSIGGTYEFNKEQAHHAGTVLRIDHEEIRLVYDGIGYFAEGIKTRNGFSALVRRQDPNINELDLKVTVCVALIRRDKFELVLQKLTELGVSRIVPFESSRCVVHASSEKKEKLSARWNAIVLEASEQCKRNRIPEVTATVKFNHLDQSKSELNLAAYEKAGNTAPTITKLLDRQSSLTAVIGPEGGFSTQEVEQLEQMGYQCVSLGSRILRAETASIYVMSAAAEWSSSK